MRVISLNSDRVTVELEFDAVEYIGMELPQSDGFTRDWWAHVWKPMLALRDDA